MSPPILLAAAMRGFQPSRVLLTALELDLFAKLGEGATAGELAACLGTDPRATAILCNALVALGALSLESGRYACTAAAACFLGPQRKGWLHTVHLWDSWGGLTQAVRTGAPAAVEHGDAWREAFIAAMELNSAERAPRLVAALGAEKITRLLDVGGGSAAYSIALAQANPRLTAVVFDLPAVLPLTERYIDAAGLAARVTTLAGDLRTDSFGSGFDLVLVSNICHMLNEAENVDLLRRCRAALVAGGRVAIQEFVLDDAKIGPLPATLFAVNMLVGTERGNAYSGAEYTTWLRDAGFCGVQRIDHAPPSSLIIATAQRSTHAQS